MKYRLWKDNIFYNKYNKGTDPYAGLVFGEPRATPLFLARFNRPPQNAYCSLVCCATMIVPQQIPQCNLHYALTSAAATGK